MVSSVLSSLVGFLSVILLPAVWASYCTSYLDMDGVYHDTQQCASQYCCGDCNKKYCCSEKKLHLNQHTQESCIYSPNESVLSMPVVLGVILGTVFLITLGVGLVICCVSPCCLFYKKCRKGHNQRNRNVRTAPQQPLSTYPPPYPGYQPVPAQLGHGDLPVPTAPPPSYLEATNAAHSPVAFSPGQPYAPPHPDEPAQLPNNPSCGPNP